MDSTPNAAADAAVDAAQPSGSAVGTSSSLLQSSSDVGTGAESQSLDISSHTPVAPSSRRSSTASATPEPPRWRFVKEAKKSLGYSSFHAGSYIRGYSSEQLGAKYVAPNFSTNKQTNVGEQTAISSIANDGEAEEPSRSDVQANIEVGKLGNIDNQEMNMLNPTSSSNQVGKLQFEQSHIVDESFSGAFAGLPINQPINEASRAPFKQWDVNYHINPKGERSNEWFDGKVNDQYIMPGDETVTPNERSVGKLNFDNAGEVEDVFTGVYPLRRKGLGPNSNVGNGAQNQLSHVVGDEMVEANDGGQHAIDGEHNSIEDHDEYHEEFLSHLGNGNTAKAGHDLQHHPGQHEDGKQDDMFEDNVGYPPDMFPPKEPASTDDDEVPEDTDEKKERRKRCYYFLIPLLLLAAILGMVFGTQTEGGTDTDGFVPAGIILPIILNETDIPSFQPSVLPTSSRQPSRPPSSEPSVLPSSQPSSIPSATPSTRPSLLPSAHPTSNPSTTPSTSSPTNSPVEFLGACPESFQTLSSYNAGAQVEVDNMIYECKSESCGSHWFGMVPLASALLKQGWKGPVGSCLGTREPTVSPTLSPSSSPSRSPSRSPSNSPSSSPTQRPTISPTPKPSKSPSSSPTRRPTVSPTTMEPTIHPTDPPSLAPSCSEPGINLCFAIDMSGSVCPNRNLKAVLRAGCNNFNKMTEFSVNLINKMEEDIDADKSFSVVRFSSDAVLMSSLTSAENTVQVIEGLDFTGGATNTADGIKACQSSFASSSSDRKNFILMITDGLPNCGWTCNNTEKDAEEEASTAKEAGTTIIPIFIDKLKDIEKEGQKFMEKISSDGEVLDVTDFESLNTLQDGLIDAFTCD